MSARDILEAHVLPYLDAAEVGLLDDLNPKQTGKYWTLDCPDCKETHKQRAYYWATGTIVCNRTESCGYTGTIWKYLVESKKLSKQEAFLSLCQAVNIDPDQFKEDNKETIAPAHTAFQQIVRAFAKSNPHEISNFCNDRNLSQDEFNELNYGYYPSAKEVREAFLQKGYSFEEISTLGFVPFTREDERKNNAYFMTGRIIGFWPQAHGFSYWGYLPKNKRKANGNGKGLDEKKYLIASSIKKDIPYSFRALRPKWPVFVEGTIDSDTLNLLGINSGATGFNRITADQAAYIQSKGINHCSFMMDGDFAGLTGAISTIFNCGENNIECWVISTPFKLEDADAMRQNKQYSELYALMDTATKPGEFLANVWVHARNTHDSRYISLITQIENHIPHCLSFISNDFYNQLNFYGYSNVESQLKMKKLAALNNINLDSPEVISALKVIFAEAN
jgi:hypothetical protein